MIRHVLPNVAILSVFVVVITLFISLLYHEVAYTTINNSKLDFKVCLKDWEQPRYAVEAATESDQDIPVLMYHHIVAEDDLDSDIYGEDDKDVADTVVTLENFKKQMAYLYNHGYTTLTMQEFENYMVKGHQIPDKSVLITFDDGYKNNYEHAYPVLKKYDFKATIFIITGALQKKKQKYKPNELQYLSLSEVESSCDVFDYGSHTHDFHKRNSKDESYLVSKERSVIKDDIEKSIEIIGEQTSAFAYPYGEYNQQTLDILDDLDITLAFTVTEERASRSDALLEINRHTVFPDTDLEDFVNLIE